MRIAFPTLRVGLYPVRPGQVMDFDTTARLFKWGRRAGFDGVELEDDTFGLTSMSEGELTRFGELIEASGLVPVAIKNGGDLYTPGVAEKNERALIGAVRVAKVLGAGIISTSLGTPVDHLGISNDERVGGTFGYAGSDWAREEDFVATANALRRICAVAQDANVQLSLEIRSTSIADDSKSVLKLRALVDHPALGLNPDVANMVWAYVKPTEDWRDCLEAMLPFMNYLHMKNLYGMRIPELRRSIFKRGPLWDGVIDFRFLLARVVHAGYDDWCVIEGAGSGDMLHNFEQGLAYVRKLLAEIREVA